MRITVEALKAAYACEEGVADFIIAFPKGIPSNKAEAFEIALNNPHLAYEWAAARMLSDEALEAYRAVEKPALGAYRAIEEPALEAYNASNLTSWGAYEAIEKPARDAYEATQIKAFVDAYFLDNPE